MEPWRRYQHDVADFYRSLGFRAQVDVRGYGGARGSHDIDVLVQSTSGGMISTWIIECKHWARPVSKEHVLALQSIVADVGAERGLLVSESGFRAGTYRVASGSNVALTSLSDLRENTQEERAAAALTVASGQIATVSRRVSALWPWARPLTPDGPFTVDEMLEAAAPSFELRNFVLPRILSGESLRGLPSLGRYASWKIRWKRRRSCSPRFTNGFWRWRLSVTSRCSWSPNTSRSYNGTSTPSSIGGNVTQPTTTTRQ